jgi:hypothetical protein
MFCTNCGTHLDDNARFCTGCGAKMEEKHQEQPSVTAIPTSPSPQDPVSGYSNTPAPKSKKPLFIALGILAGFALISMTLLVFILPGKKQLRLGATQSEIRLTVPVKGGFIEVSDENSPVKGLTIFVEPDSFKQDRMFDISSTEIKSHNFGSIFTPITPLITIDNDHLFSNKPLRVQIPIELGEDEFAMGFFYDRKTGKMEAIPFSSYAADNIVLLTHHFSDIVVSKISIAELEKLATAGNVSAKTDFEPGRDDWQFTNYGSAIAPGGHCAGQSLTMAWYYRQKHQAEKAPRLYGLFDNNGDVKTVNFWQDDSECYRFASVIQHLINWESQLFHNYLVFSTIHQRKVFYAFAYAIRVTGEPQFMGINSYDSNGVRTGGHAIVAYKVENGRIYVADPNYPGQKDRYCEIDTDGFKPYSSGANAADINESGTVLYTKMDFIASSALIDFELIAENYEKMMDQTVGDDLFPDTRFSYMSEYKPTFEQTVWSDIVEVVTLSQEYAESLPSQFQGQVLIRVTPNAPQLVYTLYLDNNTQPEANPSIEILDGSLYYEIVLKKGINHIAFLVEKQIGDGYRYVDFKRIRIDFDSRANTSSLPPVQSGTVKVVCAFHSNYVNTPAIYEKEFNIGDPFPYDYVDGWFLEVSGHRFVGYYTDPELTTPLTFSTVPANDVYVYTKFVKMSQSEMLGKYYNDSPYDYIEYDYYEFLAGSIVKYVYKYKDDGKVYTGMGTWTMRETPYGDYSITSFDVDMESSSFPLHFVVYEGRVRESSGKMYSKK